MKSTYPHVFLLIKSAFFATRRSPRSSLRTVDCCIRWYWASSGMWKVEWSHTCQWRCCGWRRVRWALGWESPLGDVISSHWSIVCHWRGGVLRDGGPCSLEAFQLGQRRAWILDHLESGLGTTVDPEGSSRSLTPGHSIHFDSLYRIESGHQMVIK